MNDPMKRNISGSANGAKTSLAGATLKTMHSDAPMSAEIGIGRLSHIHSVMTTAMIAARLCASALKLSGAK